MQQISSTYSTETTFSCYLLAFEQTMLKLLRYSANHLTLEKIVVGEVIDAPVATVAKYTHVLKSPQVM